MKVAIAIASIGYVLLMTLGPAIATVADAAAPRCIHSFSGVFRAQAVSYALALPRRGAGTIRFWCIDGAKPAKLKMNMRRLENRFYTNANWEKPLRLKSVPGPEMIRLFDQNGYRLTDLEVLYAEANQQLTVAHRNERALKKEWFLQEKKTTGPILNHAALFERKGYEGRALEQLTSWARENHTLFKLVKYRPKWGIDFSMDYVDGEGNAMELLHYEFDSFDFNEIQQMKLKLEPIFAGMDWEDAARELIKRKNEWHGLDFFAQSDWKSAFFGLSPERFKMVAWE